MEPVLVDPFRRKIEYLRVSVTDRCDLRCSYCLPKGFDDFEEPGHWLTFDEIERIVRAFTELGVKRVRLTGGEPLTRRDLPLLAGRLARLPGLEDLSLSTNAVQLRRDARALRAAGVTRLNVSLDSLKAERFAKITGGGKLARVLEGLEAARAEGFAPIKINMVALKGVNDDEIGDMVRFCAANGFTLRLIETMPVGDTGRAASGHYLDLQEVRAGLEREFELIPSVTSGGGIHGGGPARYFQVAGTDLNIGFITPISQHFCETCNRVRLGVDGELYLCLGQDDKVELGRMLRAGIDGAALRDTIRAAIAHKPQRHEFRETPEKIVRFMARTGG
jgi:cyclic pyranopterin phosphate synthase